MNTIVAVADGFAIGKNGDLLVRLPEDLRRFKELTTGKVVVMGYNTFLSLPGSRPLKNRTNIVLTRNPHYQVKDALVFHTVEDVLEELKKYPSEDIYIIGGSSIYREFLPYCDVAHITRIDHAYEADTYFPDMDDMPEWKLTGQSEEKTYFDLEFTFCRYERQEN